MYFSNVQIILYNFRSWIPIFEEQMIYFKVNYFFFNTVSEKHRPYINPIASKSKFPGPQRHMYTTPVDFMR